MVVMVWAVAVAAALFTAVDTAVGPVLFSISRRHGCCCGSRAGGHRHTLMSVISACCSTGGSGWWS
jgi:hypothetical protein